LANSTGLPDLNHGDLNHGDLNHGDLNHGDLNHGDLNHGDLNHKIQIVRDTLYHHKILSAPFCGQKGRQVTKWLYRGAWAVDVLVSHTIISVAETWKLNFH